MIRDNRDDGLQSIRLVFAALTLLLGVDLPSNFEDIRTVNVYEANGDEEDDWKTLLNDQGQAWIITPLHYTKGGLRIIRKASGGGTWNQKEKNHENAFYCVRTYNFAENKNKKQATNEGMGLPKYTMIEYTPPEDKPKYALCQITVDNKKSAHDRPPSSSQQPKRMPKHALCQITVDNENYAHDRPPSSSQQQKNMEIDHTDSNNGDKRKTSLSHKIIQQAGGNSENATGYDNQSKLEICIEQFVQGEQLSEFKKHHSNDHIVQVFSRKMNENSAASPKEHSTEAAVRNPRKRSHGTIMKTIMEADVSTQRKKQAKVEILGLKEFVNSPCSVNQNNRRQSIPSNNSGHKMMFESNSSQEKGEQSSHHSNYTGTSTSTGATFEQWNADPRPDKDTLEELVSSCSTHHDASYKLDDRPLVETRGRLDQQMFESNSSREMGEQSSHHSNYIGTSTSSGATFDQWIAYPSPANDTLGLVSSCSTHYKLDDRSQLVETGGRLDRQVFEQNAQDPHNLSHNFNANSTEPTENQNRIETDPSMTSIFVTTEGRLDHQEPKLYHNTNGNSTEPVLNSNHLLSCYQNITAPCPSTGNYATTEGRLNHQIFEPNENAQEPNNLSVNFNANFTTEPTENSIHLPSYYQNTIAPGPSMSNYTLHRNTNRNCSEFEEQSSHHGNCNEKNAEQVTNPINLADHAESWTFEELCLLCDDHEMVEQNAVVRETNQLSPNFNVSSTEPMDNQNRIASDPSTSIFLTAEGRLDHQVQVQAPGPNTSNHSTIVPENIDSNNIFEGLTDLNPEDLHANRSCTRRHENGTIWDNLPWVESKSNSWDL